MDDDSNNKYKPKRIVIAPIVGLFKCDFSGQELKLAENLVFLRNPEIAIDKEIEVSCGSAAINDLKMSGWGFQHSYPIESETTNERSHDLIKRALISLWIAKPTGAHVTFFLQYQEPRISDTTSDVIWSTDTLKPNRKYINETLSFKDLQIMKDVYKNVNKIRDNKTRLSLTLYHLYGALHIWIPHPRLVMFLSVLESLFSTSPQEISHKISERTAFFFEKDSSKRRELYDFIKNIYNIRSKIVHGSQVSRKDIEPPKDKLADLEFFIHRLLQKIFTDNELVEIFSSGNEVREQYFKDLLFS